MEEPVCPGHGYPKGASQRDQNQPGMCMEHVTSRLAYDGSGKVLRGKESDRTTDNYSICEFSTGKIYHCDLNASYNIGA